MENEILKNLLNLVFIIIAMIAFKFLVIESVVRYDRDGTYGAFNRPYIQLKIEHKDNKY